jgi:hypothetical protein
MDRSKSVQLLDSSLVRVLLFAAEAHLPFFAKGCPTRKARYYFRTMRISQHSTQEKKKTKEKFSWSEIESPTDFSTAFRVLNAR